MTQASAEVILDKEELRSLVASVVDLDVSEVTDDSHFIDDLELDSLMTLEVVVVLERTYGVRFVESELRTVSSLNLAYDLLSAKLRRS